MADPGTKTNFAFTDENDGEADNELEDFNGTQQRIEEDDQEQEGSMKSRYEIGTYVRAPPRTTYHKCRRKCKCKRILR
jgi:uncharacterized protein YgfB (UPF0149 family)